MALGKERGALMRPLSKSSSFRSPAFHRIHNVITRLIEETAEGFHLAAHHHLAIFMLGDAGNAYYEETATGLAFIDEFGNQGNELLFIVLDEQAASINGEFHGFE
jgi:hypothetical protein